MEVSVKSVKYALATFIAISFAQSIHLQYPVTAGIIAILSLAETNKATGRYIKQITIAMLVSLFVARLLFTIMGYQVWVFSLYLLIAYPMTVKLKSQRAIAPCAVSVSHLLLEQTVVWPWLVNEFLLLVIGTGVAMFVNLYQPSKSKKIEAMQVTVETEMKKVLNTFSHSLANGDACFEGATSLDKLSDNIRHALTLVEVESENRLTRNFKYYYQYFEMRNAQLRLLYEVNESLCEVGSAIPQHQALAKFLKHTSEQLQEKNPAVALEIELREIYRHYENESLPESREEFEERAILFEILRDCQSFLHLKRRFYKSNQQH